MRKAFTTYILKKGYKLKDASVLYLTAQGLEPSTISERMCIPTNTIKSIYAKVYKREGIRSKTNLLIWLNDVICEVSYGREKEK